MNMMKLQIRETRESLREAEDARIESIRARTEIAKARREITEARREALAIRIAAMRSAGATGNARMKNVKRSENIKAPKSAKKRLRRRAEARRAPRVSAREAKNQGIIEKILFTRKS